MCKFDRFIAANFVSSALVVCLGVLTAGSVESGPVLVARGGDVIPDPMSSTCNSHGHSIWLNCNLHNDNCQGSFRGSITIPQHNYLMLATETGAYCSGTQCDLHPPRHDFSYFCIMD